MKLKKSRAGGGDADGFGVIVQFLPTWTAVPVARRSQEMPNPTIVVQLVQLVFDSSNCNSGGIVVEPFPPGAIFSIAGRTGVAPIQPSLWSW